MTSPAVTTPNKTSKRIPPGTPVAVTAPYEGNISLFYKGQVFTPGQEKSSDEIYHSTYANGRWKGGLDATPICPSPAANRMTAISWSKVEVSVLHRNWNRKTVNRDDCINRNVSISSTAIIPFRSTPTQATNQINGFLAPCKKI